MTSAQVDVVVVGAGCAGLTAALGLARAGFAVAVVEAAEEPGGAAMLGGVYLADRLGQADLLDTDGAKALAWERRLTERGGFVTDGRRLAGCIYRDSEAFRSSYIILRSHFNRSLAQAARAYGVSIHTETAVESLIREGRRIIGVATTRGPFYARLVFLAEGDAGLLVSREGLDRSSDPRDQPAFLYCLQQILDLPPGAVEERFGVAPDQGVAYDFLLRNPAAMPLNARGMLCTNQQGLTVSIVLPMTNLQRWFTGTPRQLLDWFVDMPVLQPWLREGRAGAWTAALLRTGGLRDAPYLVEDGLAIGGAAAGLGTDFPVLNLITPALATGVLLSRAAIRIRAEGNSFDRDALVRYYLNPLQQTRYWCDAEFVQRWPGYLRRAHVLFGHGLDLLLDSARVWTRARRWLPWKFLAWISVLSRVSWREWNDLRDELLQLGRVLRLREIAPRLALARLLLDGSLNAFRDLLRQPRPQLPLHGALRLFYYAAEENGRAGSAPWVFRRWFERFRPVLAAAARMFHTGDDSSLSARWINSIELLLRQINLFDFLAVIGLAFPIALASTMLAVLRGIRRRPAEEKRLQVPFSEKSVPDTFMPANPKLPLIHIAWRLTQPAQQAESVRDLLHVCPTSVFEILGMPPGTVRVAVHAERCTFCQACWRANPLVNWGFNGSPLYPYFPHVSANAFPHGELTSLLHELERKLWEFEVALADGPALVDRPHNDYLETLARYAEQLANRICEVLHADFETTRQVRHSVLLLADALADRAEERTRRTWEGRLAWAACDGRLLRQHHLAQLRLLLAVPPPPEKPEKQTLTSRSHFLDDLPFLLNADAVVQHLLAGLAARRYLLEVLEQNAPLPALAQNELLAALAVEACDQLAANMQELHMITRDNFTLINPNYDPTASVAYVRHGRRLCEDCEEARKLLDVSGDWQRMVQLRVLRAELEEVTVSQRRLLALATSLSAGPGQPVDDEISASVGRQAAHILAGKLLLLRTFAHLEKGDDAELSTVLLRVWLDHTAILLDRLGTIARECLRPAVPANDRPLVEPDRGEPLRTQSEYLTEPSTYQSGDFLLFSLNLLQPRLVPEMVGEKEIIVADPQAAELLRLLKSSGPGAPVHGPAPLCSLAAWIFYAAEALAVETIGRYAANPSALFDLESACARLILASVGGFGSALRERCVILRALVEIVIPRWLRGEKDTKAWHLQRDLLELEALKADFHRRLTAGWHVFGQALGQNSDVQASCFALAEAAAWLKAADSVLGRMGWLSWLCQAEEREEPASQREIAYRALSYCFAEIRDRLFRFDEDLASLRRGYYAPHVYAARRLLNDMG